MTAGDFWCALSCEVAISSSRTAKDDQGIEDWTWRPAKSDNSSEDWKIRDGRSWHPIPMLGAPPFFMIGQDEIFAQAQKRFVAQHQ